MASFNSSRASAASISTMHTSAADLELHGLHVEAYRNVVTAELSHRIDMPQIQDVLGASGGEHIMANCCNTSVPLQDTVMFTLPPRRKSSKSMSFFEDQTQDIPSKPPVFFRDLLLAIEKSAHAEGLFRVPGNEGRVKTLKGLVDARKYVNFELLIKRGPQDEGCKVEDLISVMKSYLRSFKEPIIPSYQHDAYLQAAELADDQKRLEVVQLLLLVCPPENRHFLQMLFKCLSVVLQAEGNKMDSGNLCNCIAPTIISLDDLEQATVLTRFGIVRFMIANSANIFQVPDEIPARVADYLRKDLEDSLIADAGDSAMVERNKKDEEEVNYELWEQWEQFRVQGEEKGGKDGKRMVKKAIEMQKKLYNQTFAQDAPPKTPKTARMKTPLKLLNRLMTPGRSTAKKGYQPSLQSRKKASFDGTPFGRKQSFDSTLFQRQQSQECTPSLQYQGSYAAPVRYCTALGSSPVAPLSVGRRTSDLDEVKKMRTLNLDADDDDKENYDGPPSVPATPNTAALFPPEPLQAAAVQPPRFSKIRQTFV